MAAYIHLDEARRAAATALEAVLGAEDALERAVLIDDIYGKLRVVLWRATGADDARVRAAIDDALVPVAGQYWTGDVWVCDEHTGHSDRRVYDAAWDEGEPLSDRLRIEDRHRNRTAWFTRHRRPPWPAQPHEAIGGPEGAVTGEPIGADLGPPIVVFWSFKGGVGRTTALASFALARARQGERVAVMDFDLDAPGVGGLLAADERGTTAQWGVVDYLLERAHGPVPLADYHHRCARPDVTGDGGIDVVPAGRLDEAYLTKLSRVDLESTASYTPHPVDVLMRDVRADLRPDWILVDARAGLSPAAGVLLSGLCHLHVLVGTASGQTFKGIERVVHHLGAARLRSPDASLHDQADCLIVQSMVPDNKVVEPAATEAFRARMEDIFSGHYYVAADQADEEDRLWSVADLDNDAAPHQPVVVPYRDRFAFFERIDQVADELVDGKPYRELDRRIRERFPATDAVVLAESEEAD